MSQLIRVRAPRTWPLLITSALAATCFAILGLIVGLSARIPREAAIVRDWHNATSSGAMDQLMKATTLVGGPAVLLPLTLILGVALAIRRRLGCAIFLVGGLCGAYVLEKATKLAFHRTRPDLFPKLATESDYSFPSGHAVGSTALMLALCLMLLAQGRFRWILGALAAVFVVAVGFSRIYLGVHYLSDVLAGWCLAVAWVSSWALVAWPQHASSPRPRTE